MASHVHSLDDILVWQVRKHGSVNIIRSPDNSGMKLSEVIFGILTAKNLVAVQIVLGVIVPI
ncbi:MAG: hypothetical protein KAT00_06030, partial [Planctomycetes bacterium]|nr:hypothetical protein [Planctomycetota bacterium]